MPELYYLHILGMYWKKYVYIAQGHPCQIIHLSKRNLQDNHSTIHFYKKISLVLSNTNCKNP